MGLSKLIEAVKNSKANGSSGSNIVSSGTKVSRKKFYNVCAELDSTTEGYVRYRARNPYYVASPREAAQRFLRGIVTGVDAPDTCVGMDVQTFEWDPEEDEPTISRDDDDDEYTEHIPFVDKTATFDLPTTVLTVNAQGVVIKDEPKSPDDIVCDLCNQPKHLPGSEVDCEGACDGPAGECECSHHNF